MDRVIAVLAVATSVLAVLAGLDRWMLPTIRQRQYALLTQMRDDEKDPERRVTLDHARTTATAVQVGAFWVPSVRMWQFPAVAVAVASLMFWTPFVLLVDDTEVVWSDFAGWVTSGTFALFGSSALGYATYLRRMAYVRQYLQVGTLSTPTFRLSALRIPVLFLWALMLTGPSLVVGLLASGYFDGVATNASLLGVAVAGVAGVLLAGRYLLVAEREFMEPGRVPLKARVAVTANAEQKGTTRAGARRDLARGAPGKAFPGVCRADGSPSGGGPSVLLAVVLVVCRWMCRGHR